MADKCGCFNLWSSGKSICAGIAKYSFIVGWKFSVLQLICEVAPYLYSGSNPLALFIFPRWTLLKSYLELSWVPVLKWVDSYFHISRESKIAELSIRVSIPTLKCPCIVSVVLSLSIPSFEPTSPSIPHMILWIASHPTHSSHVSYSFFPWQGDPCASTTLFLNTKPL